MDSNFPKNEKEILKFWKDNNVFEKVKEKNKGKKPWSFLDGPITANNPMGVHHAWGRTYKDLFQRYKAMQGFDQRFQNGFDCQGLWVEVEVEKELGFKNKKDIEDFGIDKFVEKCKERVRKYSKIQTEQSIRLGQWMDWENSYYTMSDENNYAIWGFLKKCHEKGYLYKGRDVVPWCARCGTSISQHEILTEEYKETIHKSIFFKAPIKGEKNKYFLAWTTTPWTLPANVSLAVHPELVYAEVKDRENNAFILLKSKAEIVGGGEIIREFLGKELEGKEYSGVFDDLEASVKSHKVILWKDVSEQEGTGVVHIAPGCGQEDFALSKELGLPVIDPTDKESKYKDNFGFLKGVPVLEAADLIFNNLKEKGFVYKIEDYKHRYPFCWRCKTELIFRLVDEWYISMDKIRDDLIEIAKTINWIPSFGLDREIDWLKNMHDWLISKKRYWGLALPIFECRCGNFEVIGTKQELKERAIEGWDDFEGKSPHRPFIDKIKIKCKKCGEKAVRIKDVGNPWLDAGIIPFSTLVDSKKNEVSYFSENRDYWKKWFPFDLICESFPGQFKNWFYAIIVMSAVLENKSPVKTIFGYASARDEKGEEMHKSKGNAIWLDDAVEKIGADPIRWLYTKQNPANNLNFGYKTAEETQRKLLILLNIASFFNTYADKSRLRQDIAPENILDKWLLSRFNNLLKKVNSALEKYNAFSAFSEIESFFINDFSLWYVRRSRKRLRQDSKEGARAANVFYYVLISLIKIIAPALPFLAEKIYLEIKTKDMPLSVHLCDWPEFKKEYLDDELEEKMQEAQNIVSITLSKRAEAGIKVRQPLQGLKIRDLRLEKENDLLEIIKEEVNVKRIAFEENMEEDIELDTEITKELAEEGRDREIIRNINSLRKKMGFTPQIAIDVFLDFDISDKEKIKQETRAREVYCVSKEKVQGDIVSDILLDKKSFRFGIKKA